MFVSSVPRVKYDMTILLFLFSQMSYIIEKAAEELKQSLQDLVKQAHLCFINTLKYFRVRTIN